MAHHTRGLLADFDPERAESTRRFLEAHGLQMDVVTDGAEALERCRDGDYDVLALEALLPRANGFQVLKELKQDEATAGSHVVLMLDEGDSYGHERARLCGADVILSRPFTPTALLDALRRPPTQELAGEEGAHDDLAEIEDVLDALESRARAENPLLGHITDPLTGLFNEPFTAIKLADEFKKARRFKMPLTCLVVALEDGGQLADPSEADRLKRYVNEFAGLLLCESRDIDHLARQGALHFVALLANTPTDGGLVMGERLLSSLEQRALPLPSDGVLLASAGVSTFDGGEMESGEMLLQGAMEALERSRQWGGNRVTASDPDPATRG